MPTNLESLTADCAWPMLLDQLGESVTYTPDGGSPRTVKGVFAIGEQEIVTTDSGQIRQRTGKLIVEDHATRGLTSLADLDKFTIDGVVWAVGRWMAQQNGLQVIELVRATDLERSHENYMER